MLYLERTVNSEVHLYGSSGDSILRKENSPSKRQLSCGVHHDVRDLKIDLKVEWRPRDNFLLAHADLGSKSFDENNVSLSFDSFSCLLDHCSGVQINVDGSASFHNRKAEKVRGAGKHRNQLLQSTIVSLTRLLLFSSARYHPGHDPSPRHV